MSTEAPDGEDQNSAAQNGRCQDRTAEDRDRTAEDRDRRAVAHDKESEARDDRATMRDERADTREHDLDLPDAGAVADRAAALRDRQGGASDRTQSADDRSAAATDRVLSAMERATLAVDQLTHAYRREVGIAELTREVVRAQRTQQTFVVAFIDVDHLKERNDTLGHLAGDHLLAEVADALRTHFRSYDLIVRYGGDEFVCGLPDVSTDEVVERFERVNAGLAATLDASVSYGLAELRPDDTVEALIARADDALYGRRHGA